MSQPTWETERPPWRNCGTCCFSEFSLDQPSGECRQQRPFSPTKPSDWCGLWRWWLYPRITFLTPPPPKEITLCNKHQVSKLTPPSEWPSTEPPC